ncbi:kinesin-like protein KIN-12E isoform X2 [Benincasa hispida]|uniref:kinesin-like protein KIN-12E isoform X2 n=1 Tax=Benincasa hispida TaxID=102211 RepID=UPI0018FFA4DC|nr:kinesin-like protein KIN-12E isoform X2 [Benincasa hispida]
MPFISDTASAIKSRFGFQDHALSSGNPPRGSPDFLKSATKESVTQTSVIRSIDQFSDEDAVSDVTGSSSQCFELHEDPSFWKDHNVQVIIRIRPLSNSEVSLQGYGKCVRQESCQTVTWTGHPESRFTFDLVADENVSQEKLFKVAGLPMVDNCVGGYNSCMFAYGQTGSGKTHTMLGDIEGGTRRHSVNCGMTPRVFEYLFTRIQKEKEARKDEKLKYTCRCSFLEIYNEQILDLLDPSSNNLQIREDSKKGVYVENLKEIEVTSARDVLQQLIQGAANRKVASTNMNRASSRSHSVFTCIIESKWESQGVTHHRFARLNLVDLAGSERQKSSGAEGERLKEATNINKSLSTLGLVIMNLVNISNGKSLHVPYRDSKLTFLLQDSLGGNAKTIIIANISPSSCCSLETLSTLKFAQRAKFIKNNAIVNEDTSGDVIAMRLQIQQLKKEVSRLRGLVSGGGDNQDNDSLAVSFPGSPGTLKWDGLYGSMSPLTTGKRMTQRRDYEIALVGAFRREKDKDMALQALTNENQAAMQLAKQREDEIQGLKMRLRFREAGIKRLEAVASGKISAETHLLKEKEEHLKEIEVLKNQVDRNQEVTRFAMENLRLKEEIRRLKSFYEEGEREMVHDQIMVLENKLLEALDWKLMHESDPSSIQKGNSDMIADIDDENFLLTNQERGSPWKSSINEENGFLRMQAIHNQDEVDTLRKKLELCLEEKEKLERHVDELAAKLGSEQYTGPADRANQVELPLASTDTSTINFSDQIELMTMVDAIAAASQREANAHETAIALSKENDELRMKLRVLIEDNNKLIELYETAASECKYRNENKVETAQNDDKVAEISNEKEAHEKAVERLQQQLVEMHEENDKLMSLYEGAMQEKNELKKMLSSLERAKVDTRGESDCIEKFVGVDDGMNKACVEETLKPNEAQNLVFQSVPLEMEMLDGAEVSNKSIQSQEKSSEEQNDGLVGDELCPDINFDVKGGTQLDEEDKSVEEKDMSSLDDVKQMDVGTCMEIEPPAALIVEMLPEDLNTIRKKLERADEQLSESTRTVTVLSSLEKMIFEADKLSKQVEIVEDEVQSKQKEVESFKLALSEKQESRDLAQNKFCALRYSLTNFSSSIFYFEQRETRARERVDASKTYLDQRKKELAFLQARKDEIETRHIKIQKSEVELRSNLASLKSKIDEESQKQESDKVLFAIDNIEKTDPQPKNWQFAGRATDLLKSAEEKTKLQNEMKLAKEKLGVIRKELEDLMRKSRKVDSDIEAVQLEVQKASRSADEMEVAMQGVINEKKTLLEIQDAGITEFENIILDYQECMFEAGLKEAEIKILEEELQMEHRRMEELITAKSVAIQKMTQLLEDNRRSSCFLSEKMEEELKGIRSSVMEAKLLLGEGDLQHS